MQLLMLLAVFVVMTMPLVAARDARMNNVPGERKFLHDLPQKRTIIHLSYDLL
jgi:hypothetical protein